MATILIFCFDTHNIVQIITTSIPFVLIALLLLFVWHLEFVVLANRAVPTDCRVIDRMIEPIQQA